MKNFLFFFTLLVLSLAACNNAEPKHLACKEFDPQCELEKDYQFVKVISVEGSAIDAYGKPVIPENWYVRVRATMGLIPLRYGTGYGNFGSPNDFEIADKEEGDGTYLRIHGPVHSDTVKIGVNGVVPAVTAKLLTFGSRYVDIKNDGKGPAWYVYSGQ